MPLLRPRVVRADKPGARRQLISAADQTKLLTAILEWIPVEVIAAYKFVINLIPSDNESFRLWSSVSAIPITALWIAYATRPKGQEIAWRQVILGPIAFTCWAIAMQGDILKYVSQSWEPWMGSVVLAGGTILLPIFDGIFRALAGVYGGERARGIDPLEL